MAGLIDAALPPSAPAARTARAFEGSGEFHVDTLAAGDPSPELDGSGPGDDGAADPAATTLSMRSLTQASSSPRAEDAGAHRDALAVATSPPVASASASTSPSTEPVASTTALSARSPTSMQPLTRGAIDEPRSSTRDANLEATLRGLLQQGQTPYGAVVVMEAATGRIVAIAEHSTRGSAEALALRPIAPAASVFKVVTTSALLEAGVPTDEKVCFHGGKTRMNPSLLKDSRRDNTCVTLGEVIPKSANVAAAKLATLHLTPEQLRDHARRWGFGHTLGVKGLQPSTARIPDDAFAFAEAAAGFGDVKLSAMHGAVLAAVVANGGHLVTPTTSFDETPRHTRVIDAGAARALRRMMTETVSTGTGRRAFQKGPGLGVSAAGKTGSLTDYSTGLDSSWFVGFAPADAPEYVVSAVVVNTATWHIKAPWLAKESLRHTFRMKGGGARTGARVATR